MRDDTLAAARKGMEKAQSDLTTAKAKFDELLKKPAADAARDDVRPPTPDQALVDADAQVALAEATLKITEATLAFNELRLLADDASFASPPKASAKALAEAAARAEREIGLLQAQKGVLQAEINLEPPAETKRKAMSGR